MHAREAVMARKVIPYSRFSGKRQEAGDSQRRQDALAEQAAREEGGVLDRTITLSDRGVSAYRGANWKRGDLGKFLDLVDAGLIARGSVLVIEQVNRLSRMPWMAQVELWKEILGRGIVIRTCVPPARYTAENMDDLATGCPVVLFMMLGHLDSRQKAEWVRAAWAQKKRRAAAEGTPHGRGCPEWIEAVCQPHPLNPHRTLTVAYRLIEERAAVIRRIYEWSAGSWGAWRIHRELEASGTPAWSRRGKWSLAYVRWLLRSRHVLGEYQPMERGEDGADAPAGPAIPNYYPAAIAEDLWRAAQAARRGRNRKGGRRGAGGVDTNLFTRCVFEAVSRQPFYCTNCTVRGVGYRYLVTDPRTDGFRYRPFEDAVLDTVARLHARDVDGRHEADALTLVVDRLQQERARLGLELDSLDQQIRELPPERWPPRVVARMADLEEAITAKDDELRLAKEAANTSGRTEALADFQSCVQLLAEVRGTEREAGVRQRIKTRLPLLVESIWVRVQPINKMRRYLHVRLYLHGGEPRYFVVPVGPEGPAVVAPWPLAGADFRGGDVGGDAVDTEGLPEPDAEVLAG
jgi:DNA invertase Pin-like site-specific DNA recombinase